MIKRYIKIFDGYRTAYGLADFKHEEATVDPETGKIKPVYRWNYEPLTDKIYERHLEGILSIISDKKGLLNLIKSFTCFVPSKLSNFK